MIEWKAVIEGRLRFDELQVEGVRIGDDVGTLPFERVTRLVSYSGRRPREPGYCWYPQFAPDDASKGELVRTSTLSAMRERHGFAKIGEKRFEIVRGKVARIQLERDDLGEAPFETEADIEGQLGPAFGVERDGLSRVYHYPGRELSVAWGARTGRLEYVALGVVAWRPPSFGARELLDEWLKAACLGLEPLWHEPPKYETSPWQKAPVLSMCWLRYARVTALLRAFGLGAPEDFRQGRFLEGRPADLPPRTREAVESLERDCSSRSPLGRGDRAFGLPSFFEKLIVYRTSAEHMLMHTDNTQAVSRPLVLTAYELTLQISDGVRAALGEIDAILCENISPENLSVTQAELIARWGFPEVDPEGPDDDEP